MNIKLRILDAQNGGWGQDGKQYLSLIMIVLRLAKAGLLQTRLWERLSGQDRWNPRMHPRRAAWHSVAKACALAYVCSYWGEGCADNDVCKHVKRRRRSETLIILNCSDFDLTAMVWSGRCQRALVLRSHRQFEHGLCFCSELATESTKNRNRKSPRFSVANVPVAN